MKPNLSLLREPSTWAGMAGLFIMLGLNVEQAQGIANAGAAVAAALAVFIPEKK